ncbi:MAG: hypothetical protein HYZ73_07875 [Elusimicrobia bacterium]|nr:hypothetical protein [Elusimicrobiota bacterium]
MCSIKRHLLLAMGIVTSLNLFFPQISNAGSTLEWHKITNATEETLQVYFYIGYPLNRVYSKKLTPGQHLEIQQAVEFWSNAYSLEVVQKKTGEKEMVLWQEFFTRESLFQRKERDEIGGIVIKPKDLRRSPQ